MPAETVIQFRQGTAADWTLANPVLASGELGYETDTKQFKIGDGVTAWGTLEYFSGGVKMEEIQDNLGTSFLQAGSNIALTYDDAANTLTIATPAATLEEMQDNLGTAFLQAGSNVTLTYDDALNTLTMSASSTGETGYIDGGIPSSSYSSFIDGGDPTTVYA